MDFAPESIHAQRLFMAKIPQPLSIGEETFAQHCQAYGLKPEREFKFCEGRKWAFDFAFPEEMVAIEIEGGTAFGKSRHSRGEGFENDCRKYNAATDLGWRVLRFTTAMVQKGEHFLLLASIYSEDL
jgi:very-short-patch-repair endonuclease